MTELHETPPEKTIAQDIAFRVKRAIETQRPLFLLVYYQHEAVKLAFLRTLQLAVKKDGLSTQTFDPAQRTEHSTGKLYPLIAAASKQNILALIAGLPRTHELPTLDPSFLEYLNLHRDQIARDKLRFVLFIHSSDADAFIQGAGDLWDFRHHTYWLEGAPQKVHLPPIMPSSEVSLSEIPLSDEDAKELNKHLQTVSAIIADTAAPDEKAHLYLDLARWFSRRHLNFAGAEAAIKGLEHLPPGDTSLHAGLEHEAGYNLKQAGNLSDALSHYKCALTKFRRIGDRASEAATLSNISQIYNVWGRYDEALKYLEESLVIARDLGDRAGEAITLNNLSQFYGVRGRYDEALKYLEESLKIRRDIGDRAGEAITLNNVAQTYQALSRNDEALRYLEESLRIVREIGDRAGQAVTLNNISQIYKAWGLYDEALNCLEQSLGLSREIGNRAGEATAKNNICQIYNVWGRYDDSLKYMEESLAIVREIGDRASEAVILNNIAVIYKVWGRCEEALKYLEESLAIRREIGDRAGEAVTLNNLSQVYQVCGRNDESLKYLEESLTIRREIGDRAGEAVTSWNLGLEYQRRGDFVNALNLLRRAVEINEDTKHPDFEKANSYLNDLERKVTKGIAVDGPAGKKKQVRRP